MAGCVRAFPTAFIILALGLTTGCKRNRDSPTLHAAGLEVGGKLESISSIEWVARQERGVVRLALAADGIPRLRRTLSALESTGTVAVAIETAAMDCGVVRTGTAPGNAPMDFSAPVSLGLFPTKVVMFSRGRATVVRSSGRDWREITSRLDAEKDGSARDRQAVLVYGGDTVALPDLCSAIRSLQEAGRPEVFLVDDPSVRDDKLFQ
ncbi:MAG: hypothetical protein U0228_02400 [Myxococcaceae bacterium]